MIKKKRVFGISIFISIIVFVLYRIVLPGGGISSKDFIMHNILNGTWGEASSQITFSNIILGGILSRIYYIIPEIDWWYVVQYFLLVISLTVVMEVIFVRVKGKMGVFLAIILSLSLGFFSLYIINYQNTSATLSIAGCLVLLLGIEKEKTGFLWNLLGGFFLLISGLYSIQAIYVSILFIVGIIINLIVENRKKISIFRCLSSCKYLIVFLFISIFLHIGSEVICDRDESWTMWKDTYSLYEELKIKGIPTWNEYQEQYMALEISENDLKILEKGILDDGALFNPETIGKIQEIQKSPYNQYTILELLLYTLFRNLLGIIILIFLSIELWWGKGKVFIIIYTFLMCFLSFMYLNFQYGTLQIEKIGYFIYAGMLINVLYLLTKNEKPLLSISIEKILIVVFLVTGMILSQIDSEMGTVWKVKNNTSVRNMIDLMEKDMDSLYIIDGNSFQNGRIPSKVMSKKNVIIAGKDLSPIPIQEKLLEEYGGSSITELFLSNAEVFFLTQNLENIDIIRCYLETHYERRVEYVIEQEGDIYKVKYIIMY